MRRRDKAHRRRSKKAGASLGASQRSGSSTNKQRLKPLPPTLKKALLLAGVLCGFYVLASALSGEEEPVTVVVEKGDTLSSVAEKLEEAGVISSPAFFKLKARFQNRAAEIKPGEYQFEPGQDGDEILETLSAGVISTTVAIPEGLTLEQTAQEVEEQGGIPAEEFEEAAKKTHYGYVFLDDPDVETTEGFLFPKTYEFGKGVEASEVVDRLLQQYLVETKGLDLAGAKDRLNLTEYQIITAASLIEKEAANPEERPLIASVIYNRIRLRMPLQIDATVQYALGKPKENLTLADLKTESPYNSYTNLGLPPGPIASPSRASIEAALDPIQTDHLYYVLEADGKEHFFTNDYEEFLDAKQKRDVALTITH